MNREEILKLIKEKELKLNELTNKYIREIEKLKKELSNHNKESIVGNLSLDEKIDIFMDYFRGRDDVYPYLCINKYDSSKKYYILSCSNEWKNGVCNKIMGKSCKSCQYRENKPITRKTIEKHLYHNSTIGIYPMLEDETCYFLALDFDDKKNENHIKEDVLAFASTCDKYEIPIGIERSRSGHGIHVWIFFQDKIKAQIARKLGSLLLSKTMNIRDSLQIESFDRMFPNQDFMPKGGYGNLIALPFQTEPARYGNSIFIDRNFIQIQYNQFDYLKSIKKMTEDEVYEKIKILSSETLDISNQNLELKNEVKNKKKINAKFPSEINVVLNNMVCIDKANLSAEVKNVFRRLATFANPEFYKKQAMRMSVYNIPMIIDCSQEDEKYLKLSWGTYEYLDSLC